MEKYNVHNDMLSITRVSLALNCSPATIKRWYRWADKMGKTICEVGLPAYIPDSRGTWYFKTSQLNDLINFRNNLKRGEMSTFHKQYYWKKKKGESNG